MKRTSRKPSELSESVQRHLNAYAIAASAAGVGMLAIARPAEAKIVYTPANVKIVHPAQFFLDLNHDGTTDFFLTNKTFSVQDHGDYLQVAAGFKGNKMVVQSKGLNRGAIALRAGQTVGPHDHLASGFALMAEACIGSYCSATFFGPWANDGKGVEHRYLGFQFQIDGQTHYGWARLAVHFGKFYEDLGAHLSGYAYETIANKPIITGKIKGPDVITLEPGSLGALAAGARLQK
jgi:hypothetical protein